jgi:pimeloyl-ACP methyl ester carboxylesterase
LLFLHGGWGYEVYPFDRQMEEFGKEFRILIPDRSGYGQSGRLAEFPIDFHHRAAIEMLHFLAALELERCILWGHSDGAVIAAWMGIEKPALISGIILEAFHYYCNKPASRFFFEGGLQDPDQLGERIASILAREHGEDYWRDLIRNAAGAWVRLANQAPHPKADLLGGRLASLSVPTMLIHGARDPRTEPDEIERVRQELPQATIHVIETAGHSPHSETASYVTCNEYARQFLRGLKDLRP